MSKEELLNKCHEAISAIIPDGCLEWAKLNENLLYTKAWEYDKIIDTQWDTMSYEQLRDILREKYVKFTSLKLLYESRQKSKEE